MIDLFDATDLHRVRRRLYRVGPVRLWYPVAAVQAILTVATLILSRVLASAVGVSFSPRTIVFLLAPTAGVFALSGRDTLEHRTIGDFLMSRVRWALLPNAVVLG